METLRPVARAALHTVELAYRRMHGLQPLGAVLLLARGRYRGDPVALADGTRIERNAAVGELHFNNLGLAGMPAASAHAAARRFAREMLVSMEALADTARSDPRFADVEAFHATSWLPPHGSRMGFVALPLPPSGRTRLRAAWFRVLLWAFAPAAETRRRARPVPHAYWLSRRTLLARFPCRNSI